MMARVRGVPEKSEALFSAASWFRFDVFKFPWAQDRPLRSGGGRRSDPQRKRRPRLGLAGYLRGDGVTFSRGSRVRLEILIVSGVGSPPSQPRLRTTAGAVRVAGSLTGTAWPMEAESL